MQTLPTILLRDQCQNISGHSKARPSDSPLSLQERPQQYQVDLHAFKLWKWDLSQIQAKCVPRLINRSCPFRLPRLILCFSPERIPGVSITLMLSSTAFGSWAHTNLREKTKKRKGLTTKWCGREAWPMFRAGISLPHQCSPKGSTTCWCYCAACSLFKISTEIANLLFRIWQLFARWTA